MNRKAACRIFFLSGILVFSTGCLSFRAQPAGIEPGARYMTSPYYEVLGDAEGISSSFRLFWFIPVMPDAGFREAVDDAVKSKGGDNLIEAVYTKESLVYIVGTVNNIYVKGKVIRYIQNR